MRNDIATDTKASRVGSVWIVGAMAPFAIEDAFVKAVSQSLPVGQILILFGLGGSIIFACLALLMGARLWTPDVLSKPMCIRVVFEIIGRLFYVLAISLSALSAATVILQATPLIVVAGASLFFGERVGWRRWARSFWGLRGGWSLANRAATVFQCCRSSRLSARSASPGATLRAGQPRNLWAHLCWGFTVSSLWSLPVFSSQSGKPRLLCCPHLAPPF
ncbi:DMT family transporter [Lentibacter algarum]|uniref:EamA family transporter n=1 Tax=Lentibacter algarum TaxID=576131 RepID=UPI001C07FBBA|nr:EamA family transporter [Lentibacter algarum]MBU2983685.1 DMT family transporter [Lentibacter algarum]